MKTNIHQLTEKAIREHVRSLLDEGVKNPVSLEQGTGLYNEMKSAMIGSDPGQLSQVVRMAIRAFKFGDKADEKLAQNLRAFQGSVKSGKHPDWRIVELAYAEWNQRRKTNPVVVEAKQIEPKKTDLETIYENIENFARRNNRNVFEVLDNMMDYCEKEVSDSSPSSFDLIKDKDVGFDFEGNTIYNPLYDPAGKTEVCPYTFYGDNFMNSKFPFEFNNMYIVDPRYNETGEQEVEPETYYGDAYKSSGFFNLLTKKSPHEA